MLFSTFSLPSFTNLIISSPNNVFCQANQSRVKFVGSSLWKLSCIKPVPASVRISVSMHHLISASSVEVKAFIIIDMGQGMS